MSHAAALPNEDPVSRLRSHPLWVRICHWLVAASYLTLAVSGFLILMVHPRLYIGEVGNDLTSALLTLPTTHRFVTDHFDDQGRHGLIQNGWSWYAGI